MAAPEPASGPLGGVRVVDLSPDRVGAQVSQTLADYGADVLIETFRPGVADRWGLGYEALVDANPGLVYTSITGFGRQGRWANLKGYEVVVASVLGVCESFSGMNPGGRPPFVTVPWCTFAATHGALQGILSALYERGHSGSGQWVETNLAQAVTIHEGASSSWYTYLVSTRWPDAFVPAPATSHHFVYRLLVGQTKDGRWLQFAQNRPHLFESLLRALDLDWMLTDPKWKGIPILEDAAQREELLHRMLDGVRGRSLAEWQVVFETDRDVFAELYRDGPEALDHPQLVHDGAILELVDPEHGAVRQPGPQFAMTATPGAVRGPAPTLGDGLDPGWAPRSVGAGAAGGGAAGGGAAAGRGTAAGRGAPLAGVTVMELAVQYAAPYGPTMLADLGAR